MADRYWVGASATWDAVTILNWSATDGGLGGATVPGAGDNANFTALSGAVTVTLGYNPSVANINFTGFTGTFRDNGAARSITCTTWTAVTPMTLSISSSTLNVNGNNTFTTAAKTYGTVVLTPTGNLTVSGANATFSNITFSSSGSYPSITVPSITVSNVLTITGSNNTTQRVLFGSNSYFAASTITCNGSVSLTNVDLMGVTIAGSASWSGTSLGNAGSNSITITFTTPKTIYWVQGATASLDYISNANFSTSSGGSVSSANFPLPQDTTIFDANSFSATGKTVTCTQNGVRFSSLDFSAVTNSPTFTPASPNYYGSLTLASGMTYTPSGSTLFLGLNSNATLTTNGQTLQSFSTIYMPATTLSFGDNINCSGILTWNIGGLNFNNKNLTCTNFNSTGGSTRTLTPGSGTLQLTGTGIVLNFNGAFSPNVTIVASTGTIKLTDSSGSSKTVYGLGKVWGNFWNATSGAGVVIMADSATWQDFKINPGQTQQFTAGTTTTVSTLTANGNPINKITITSPTASTHNLVCNAKSLATRFFSCSNLIISYSVCSPLLNFYAGTSSTDGGNNTGWNFTAPPNENISSINGVSLANIAKVNGVAAANIYSIDGLT